MKVYEVSWQKTATGACGCVSAFYTEKGLSALSVRMVGAAIMGESGVRRAMKHHRELIETGDTLVNKGTPEEVLWKSSCLGDDFIYPEDQEFVTKRWAQERMAARDTAPAD